MGLTIDGVYFDSHGMARVYRNREAIYRRLKKNGYVINLDHEFIDGMEIIFATADADAEQKTIHNETDAVGHLSAVERLKQPELETTPQDLEDLCKREARFSDEEEEEILLLLFWGCGICAVAKEFGCSHTKILSVIKRHGG